MSAFDEIYKQERALGRRYVKVNTLKNVVINGLMKKYNLSDEDIKIIIDVNEEEYREILQEVSVLLSNPVALKEFEERYKDLL